MSSSSASSSTLTKLVLTAASVVAVGLAARAIDRRLFKRRQQKQQSSSSKHPKLQFDEGSREGLVQERFQKCVELIGPQIPKMPQKDQLRYYGLFKQATLGDVDVFQPNPPPAYDLVANAKYKAWQKYKGMERVAAMQDYIDKVVQFEYVKSIGGGVDDDNYELEGDAVVDVVGMGNNVSTLAAASEDDEEDAAAMAEEDKQFPLHAAAREGKVAELDALLNTAVSVDTNQQDPSGQTPLHLAADRGHLDCVKSLVLAGANVNAVDQDGISILQAAVMGGDVGCCRLLLALGCDPHQADQDGDTPAKSAKDDKELEELFAQHEKSPLTLEDEEFAKQLEKQGISIPKQEKEPVDVQQEMKKLDQPIVFDLDDDGDM